MNYQRTLEIERGDVDSESGTFRAALFTDGEATANGVDLDKSWDHIW